PLFARSDISAIKWCSRTASRTEVVFRRPSQLSAAHVEHEPRRTAPFPNGDVRPALVPQEGRWSLKKDGVTTVSQVSATSAETHGPARMCFRWWSLLDGHAGTP